METFSFLKYWRGSGGAANLRLTNSAAADMRAAATTTTTIATSVLHPSTESEDDNDDEGSFFDLEFAVNESINAELEDSTSESGDDEAEVLSDSPSASLSPSDDLLKEQLLPLEPSSILFTTAASSDSDPKSSQFSVSLLKSATRFRVFMLGLKKPKSDPNAAAVSPKQNQSNKFFVKFKVEEVPIVSLFASEGSGSSKKSEKIQKSDEESNMEEKKFSKETVQKYINKIKPLYVRVSKRYGEKLWFIGQLTANGEVTATDEAAAAEPAPAAPTATATAKVKLPAGLRVVRKKLGKSKSASSAVVAAIASPPAAAHQKSDDSLLEQQDGIQSAIAHCKRSLNAAAAAKGSQSPLVRSKSDPTREKGNEYQSG